MNLAAASGMFSLPRLVGGFLFSGIGFVAFVYGKKMARWKPAVLGLALMIYPYFVSDLWWLYGLGVLLTVSLYFCREED